MTATNGLQTAVALAGGAGEMPGAGQQPELFEADAPLPLSPAVLGRSGPKGGRPKGARNKSTEAWREWFLSSHRSPLMALGEVYSRPAADLARELQLFRRDPETGDVMRGRDGEPLLAPDAVLEAFKVQLQAMTAALPYLHQRQPMAIEVKEERLGMLVIGDLGPADANGDLALPIVEVEENQSLSQSEIEQSDVDQSDGSR